MKSTLNNTKTATLKSAKTIFASLILGGAVAGGASAADSSQPKAAKVNVDAKQASARVKENKLVADWVDLWNGNYSLAAAIVSPEVRVRAALMDGGDGSAVKGSSGMVKFITQIRSAFPDLHFDIEVGPIIDGEHIVLRWVATGTYAGGFPGATAPVGTKVTFTGADMLKTEKGLITHYWLNADTLLVVNQLKVGAAK